MKRKILSLALSLVVSTIPVLNVACNSKQLAKYADRAAKVFTTVQPTVQSLIDSGVIPKLRGGVIIVRLQEAATDSKRLADAFRSDDDVTALAMTSKVVELLNILITEDALLIPNGAQRTFVLAILASAELAIAFIVDNLAEAPEVAPVVATADARATKNLGSVAEFRKGPRLNCRSSIDGQWKQMEFCKTNPGQSTVERVKR